MTTQHSDPPREPTDTRSEVLSDATNLDALLEAILGDEIAPVTPHRRPPADITVPAVVAAARPEPAVAPPPPNGVDSRRRVRIAQPQTTTTRGDLSAKIPRSRPKSLASSPQRHDARPLHSRPRFRRRHGVTTFGFRGPSSRCLLRCCSLPLSLQRVQSACATNSRRRRPFQHPRPLRPSSRRRWSRPPVQSRRPTRRWLKSGRQRGHRKSRGESSVGHRRAA